MIALAALLALSRLEGLQNDAEAAALLRASQERVTAAQTLRARLTLSAGRGNEEFKAKIRLLAKGDRWLLECDPEARGGDESLRACLLYDGRAVRSLLPGRTPQIGPAAGAAAVRAGAHTTSFAVFICLQNREFFGRNPQGAAAFEKVKDGGVDDQKGRVVEAALKLPRYFGDQSAPAKLYFDPKTKRPVRRELDLFGSSFVEVIDELAIDEELPDEELTFQTRARLNRARAGQLAAGVELYARYQGRLPTSPADLAARPAGAAFWPEGGFALGPVPVDPWGRPYEIAAGPALRSLGADAKPGGRGDAEDVVIPLRRPTGRAVGAPSERLQKHFTSRVRLQLVAAAATAYAAAYGELPRKKASLWERGPEAEVWPEGGWMPAGMPADGWGDPLRLVTEESLVRVQVQDPKARRIAAKELTPEERAGLEAAARLTVSDAQRAELKALMDALAEDDFEKREKADEALRAAGPAAVGPLEERIRTEKDVETRARLGMIRKAIRVPPAPWPAELGLLWRRVSIDPRGGDDVQGNAFLALKTLASAEADFRGNDRDNNRVQDFWTGDVASLYTLRPAGQAESIRLIELAVAAADGAPLNDGAALEAVTERRAYRGYLFRAMARCPEGPYDAGKGRHPSRFGFVAYPEDYGGETVLTAIINEGNTVFVKDTGGEPLLEWPGDAELRSWRKLD